MAALNLQETQALYQAVENGASISDYPESDLQFQLIAQIIGYDTYVEVAATLKNAIDTNLWDIDAIRFLVPKAKKRLNELQDSANDDVEAVVQILDALDAKLTKLLGADFFEDSEFQIVPPENFAFRFQGFDMRQLVPELAVPEGEESDYLVYIKKTETGWVSILMQTNLVLATADNMKTIREASDERRLFLNVKPVVQGNFMTYLIDELNAGKTMEKALAFACAQFQ